MKRILRQAVFIIAILAIGATMLFSCAEPGTMSKMDTISIDSTDIEVYAYVLKNSQVVYIARSKRKVYPAQAAPTPVVNTVTWGESDGDGGTNTRVNITIQNDDSVVIFRK